MSQISALTAATTLPQTAQVLPQGPTAPHQHGNASPAPTSQDRVSISSEAKELQSKES